jgi:hypothetical protein
MGCSSMVRAGALYAQGCQFESGHPNKKEREVVQLVERVLWEHEVAGSSPVFPTDVEISVKVNTVACGAINKGSNPLSQPTDKWQTWCMRCSEKAKKVIRFHSCPPKLKRTNTVYFRKTTCSSIGRAAEYESAGLRFESLLVVKKYGNALTLESQAGL